MSNWVSQDITFCSTKGCPVSEYCHRAIGCKKRIASYSDFGSECNINNVFNYFIQADMKDVEERRKKKC